MKQDYFIDNIKKTDAEEKVVNKKINSLATVRLVSFIGAVVALAFGNYYNNLPLYILGAVLVIVFIAFIVIFNKVKKQSEFLEAQGQVLRTYIKRFDDSWKEEFEENGAEYINDNTKAIDLDLLGRSSLYQYICVAHTPYGKKKLANELLMGHKDSDVIKKRQEAIKELTENRDFILKLQTYSQLMKNKDENLDMETLEKFFDETEKKNKYISSGFKVFAKVMPVIVIVCGALSMFGILSPWTYYIAAFGAIVQLMLSFANMGRCNYLFDPIASINENVRLYKDFIEAIINEDVKSEYLISLKNRLDSSNGVLEGLDKLNTLATCVKQRNNFLFYFITNALVMWDINCLDAFGEWNTKYGSQMRGWLEVVGEIESLISLTVIGQVKENSSYPVVTESETPAFKFTNCMHPLIKEMQVVGNSFSLASGTSIITGSNMSGKTTFMRSVGVNLVLSYTGAQVVAEKFETTIMEIFTSMRVQDRVDEGISTFYAELLRIKEMIDYSTKHKPMVVMVDEIFKGTNSADRILGASETIKKLGNPWANVMVTTHDFELCELANTSDNRNIKNYHFEEHYEDDKIKFDYTIKNDRCHTTNAKYLLKMVGILEK